MKERNGEYTSDLPRKMYTFFQNYSDVGLPSFTKFASKIGVTTSELEGFRTNEVFDKAYLECSEIRRDYLIDKGLTKQVDSSMAKFLLASEFRMGEETISDDERNIHFTLEVIDSEN